MFPNKDARNGLISYLWLKCNHDIKQPINMFWTELTEGFVQELLSLLFTALPTHIKCGN